MFRFRKLMPAAMVALVAAMLLGAPSTSQAALTVKISVDGGTTFSTFSAAENTPNLSASVVTGGVTVGVNAFSNQPIGVQSAEVSQVQLNFNNTGAAALLDLVVRVSDQDFAAPVGTSTLQSNLSGTAQGGTASVGLTTFQSAVDFGAGNVLFGGLTGFPPVAPGAGGADFSEVPRTFVITNSFSSNANYSVLSTTPFSLSNEFRVIGLTIGGGESLQLTGTTKLVNVPAPAGLVLALAGLPILGAGHWLRRRKLS